MKKLLATLGLFGALLSPALAAQVGDAAYNITLTDVRVTTTTAFTAGRTWTLPPAAGSCLSSVCVPAANELQIIDTAGAFSQRFPLTIARQSGETINGNTADLIISNAGSRVALIPTSPGNWQAQVYDDYASAGFCASPSNTATVTISIASPAVITDTGNTVNNTCPVVFTTSGALPTGITAGTTYWKIPSTATTDTYQIATTVANALAGTAVNTSGTQSGTQTRTAGNPLTTNTQAAITGVTLSQGEYECRGVIAHTLGASTSVTQLVANINTTEATVSTQGQLNNTFYNTAANVLGVGGIDVKVGPTRFNLTATGNIYLNVRDTFTVSTDVAYGQLACRRVR